MAEICGFGLRFRNGGARKSGKTVLLAAGDAGRLSPLFPQCVCIKSKEPSPAAVSGKANGAF